MDPLGQPLSPVSAPLLTPTRGADGSYERGRDFCNVEPTRGSATPLSNGSAARVLLPASRGPARRAHRAADWPCSHTATPSPSADTVATALWSPFRPESRTALLNGCPYRLESAPHTKLDPDEVSSLHVAMAQPAGATAIAGRSKVFAPEILCRVRGEPNRPLVLVATRTRLAPLAPTGSSPRSRSRGPHRRPRALVSPSHHRRNRLRSGARQLLGSPEPAAPGRRYRIDHRLRHARWPAPMRSSAAIWRDRCQREIRPVVRKCWGPITAPRALSPAARTKACGAAGASSLSVHANSRSPRGSLASRRNVGVGAIGHDPGPSARPPANSSERRTPLSVTQTTAARPVASIATSGSKAKAEAPESTRTRRSGPPPRHRGDDTLAAAVRLPPCDRHLADGRYSGPDRCRWVVADREHGRTRTCRVSSCDRRWSRPHHCLVAGPTDRYQATIDVAPSVAATVWKMACSASSRQRQLPAPSCQPGRRQRGGRQRDGHERDRAAKSSLGRPMPTSRPRIWLRTYPDEAWYANYTL